MSSQRYEFSSDSFPLLRVFLEAVKQAPSTSKQAEHWESILPQNKALIDQLNADVENTIINLDEDLKEAMSPGAVSSYTSEEHISCTSNECNTDVEHYLNIAMQQLKTLDLMPNETFNLIECNLKQDQIVELFDHLARSLDLDHIHKLGYSIVNLSNINATVFCTLFCPIIFVKLSEEQSEKSTDVFLQLLEVFPLVVNLELSKYLVNLKDNCPRALQENLKYLKPNQKQALLREFILNCSKLEVAHFPIWQLLIDDELELGVLKKLVDVLTKSSLEYNSDKNYGKLLLQVVEKIKNIVKYFEEELGNIIRNHKSPWRQKLLKMFENAVNNADSVDQTMHF